MAVSVANVRLVSSWKLVCRSWHADIKHMVGDSNVGWLNKLLLKAELFRKEHVHVLIESRDVPALLQGMMEHRMDCLGSEGARVVYTVGAALVFLAPEGPSDTPLDDDRHLQFKGGAHSLPPAEAIKILPASLLVPGAIKSFVAAMYAKETATLLPLRRVFRRNVCTWASHVVLRLVTGLPTDACTQALVDTGIIRAVIAAALAYPDDCNVQTSICGTLRRLTHLNPEWQAAVFEAGATGTILPR